MADSDQVKAALTALADGEVDSDDGGGATQLADRDTSGMGRTVRDEADDDADYRTVIEQATAATDDLDAAVAFVETFGVGRLEAAVAQAEHEVSGLADEGRAALRTFRRYRDAAAGADVEV
jgi:nitrate reductase assembly molybdenum cofactor insertion protein NarJ